MFDYVKNKFNQTPKLFLDCNLNLDDYLYVFYSSAPFLKIPSNLNDFKQHHKSKFWYNLKRSESLFKKSFGNFQFIIVKSSEELNMYLDLVQELFAKNWSNRYTSSLWKNKNGFKTYKNAMIDLSKDNKAFLALLLDDDKSILSFAYCLNNEDTVYFYQHATIRDKKYKKLSLGKILIKKLIEYCIVETHFKFFDFMIGESNYKKEWTSMSRFVYVKIGKKNIFNLFVSFVYRLKFFFQFNFITRPILKKIFFLIKI